MSFLNLHQPEKNHASSSCSLLLSPLQNNEHRVFSCSYCNRKFYSPQAFGGHQNSHKLERNLSKKSRELTSGSRHQPEWTCMPSRSGFDTNDSTHGALAQPHVTVGIHDQEVSGSPEKGDSVKDGLIHLDLSLRL